MGLVIADCTITMATLSLNQTLRDLDAVPTLLESIRLRSTCDRWIQQAEELAGKATHALEQLAVHFEDEDESEAYKEPREFRRLRALEKHLELIMNTDNLQKLFKEKIEDPEMVELLLSWDSLCSPVYAGLRVDPSAEENWAIRCASENGYEAVVKLLLADRDASGRLCVDPSVDNNYPIRMASRNGHVAVVDQLPIS